MIPPAFPELTRVMHWAAHRSCSTLRAAGFAPDLEDAEAGALFGAWRAHETYEAGHGTTFPTWAYRWVIRYADLEARASAGLTTRGDGPHLHDLAAVERETAPLPALGATLRPVDTEEDWTDRLWVRGAVRGLPERDRQVLFLWYWVDLEQQQIAARLGLSRARVRYIHARACERLKSQMLDAEGVFT